MPYFTLTYADGTTEYVHVSGEPRLTLDQGSVTFDTATGVVCAVLSDDLPEDEPVEEEEAPKKTAAKKKA